MPIPDTRWVSSILTEHFKLVIYIVLTNNFRMKHISSLLETPQVQSAFYSLNFAFQNCIWILMLILWRLYSPPLYHMGLIIPVLSGSLCVYIRVNSRAAWDRTGHILLGIFPEAPGKQEKKLVQDSCHAISTKTLVSTVEVELKFLGTEKFLTIWKFRGPDLIMAENYNGQKQSYYIT